MQCDLATCPNDAIVLIGFYGTTKLYPYCQPHAFTARGELRWEGKVRRVEKVARR